MKRLATVLVLVAASTSLVLATPGDPCGVFAIGAQKIDLTKGQTSVSVDSRDALIASVKNGFSFTGNGDCAGTYEIVNMKLRVATAEADINYDYDFEMIRQMPGMEDYMLTRYFIDAKTLYFSQITVKNEKGEMLHVADVSFSVQ